MASSSSGLLSAWVTAKKLDGAISIKSHITSDESNVDSQAKSVELTIEKLYSSISSDLAYIASEYRTMKKDSFRGDKFKKDIEKVAGRCSTRSQATKSRLKELKDAFRYATLESKVSALEQLLQKVSAAEEDSSN